MGKAVVNYTINPISAIRKYLNERETIVLEMRLGINGYDHMHTLEEISKFIQYKFNKEKTVFRERVRQIEATALRKLQHPSKECCVTFKDKK